MQNSCHHTALIYSFTTLSATIIVFQGGDITWIPPYQITTACKFDMHWFPFDEQTCVIKVSDRLKKRK